LYLHPEVRGGAVATELAKRMKDYMNDVQCRGYFSIADSPHVAKICESQGMARLDSPVFVSIPETGKEAT
jgi:hypothetical protein